MYILYLYVDIKIKLTRELRGDRYAAAGHGRQRALINGGRAGNARGFDALHMLRDVHLVGACVCVLVVLGLNI